MGAELQINRKSKGTINAVRQSFNLLDRSTRIKIVLVSFLQVILSLLDLVSVLLIGLIASLAIRGVNSLGPGDRTEKILNFLHVDSFSLQGQVLILTVIAVVLLLGKTISSVMLTRKTLQFLALRGSGLAANLISNILQLPIDKLQQVGLYNLQYSFGAGVASITLGVVGVSTTIVADASLLLVLSIGLGYLNPSVALLSLVFFGGIALALHFSIRSHAQQIGKKIIDSEILTNQRIAESFSMYKELFVRARRQQYATEISELRKVTALAQADQTFLPNLSKYLIEVSLVVGAVLISGIHFITQSGTSAMASLGLFLMAGSRIAPALLRLQQSFLQLESNVESVNSTLRILVKYSRSANHFADQEKIDFIYKDFSPKIEIRDLCKNFDNGTFGFGPTSLTIYPGEFIAVVGPSGSGKTSFVNLILGVLVPTSGTVHISGKPPQDSILRWPGAIAYVPQEVGITTGSIAQNLELGLDATETSGDALLKAIETSELSDFVAGLEKGTESKIGDGGAQLSGGQRQRIGLARALYTRPKLLVLDEATSALDSETEHAITDTLLELQGQTTLLVIAHRLSTVRNADRVLYIDNGKILADGTFEKVREEIPNFDQQAKLMGL
jgi:ATP-binding cassette, subfamily B, bacterial PglK